MPGLLGEKVIPYLLGLPASERPPLPQTRAEEQRSRTLSALLQLGHTLSEQQPVVLAAEDLHWSDPSTLEVLGRMVEQAPTSRVLLVLTFRPEFRAPWAQSHVSELKLAPLSRRVTRGMITHAVGGRLPEPVLARSGHPVTVLRFKKPGCKGAGLAAQSHQAGSGGSTRMPAELSHLERIRSAPRSFVTRRVPVEAARGLVEGNVAPRAGDLVLARIDALGHHTRLQLPSGRRRHFFPGDEVWLAYADRYAPRQFEAIVPRDLGRCHLVAGGGIAGVAMSWHARIVRGPTSITPVGLLAGASGRPLNVADFALPAPQGHPAARPTRIALLGTSMDSGKTTSAAFLARGLVRAGLQVGYAKLTGTGAGGDPWLLTDAGAAPVLDFTDAGLASTYRVGVGQVGRVAAELLSHLDHAGIDVVLVELADGLYQTETEMLLRSELLSRSLDGVLFAASDAMGAAAGAAVLRDLGLRVLGLTGTFTSSPLAQREALAATRLAVFGRSELAEPVTARKLVGEARD